MCSECGASKLSRNRRFAGHVLPRQIIIPTTFFFPPLAFLCICLTLWCHICISDGDGASVSLSQRQLLFCFSGSLRSRLQTSGVSKYSCAVYTVHLVCLSLGIDIRGQMQQSFGCRWKQERRIQTLAKRISGL